MTRDDLLALMSQPQRLQATDLEPLRQLVEAYPYCASFVFLYLYGLARARDVRYASELKRLAIYLPLRSGLYRLVEQGDNSSLETSIEPSAEPDAFSLIDSFLNEARASGADLPSELRFEAGLAEGRDYFEGESVGEASTPLVPPHATIRTTEGEPPLTIPRVGEEDTMGEALSEELFTETLAKIYIQQGRYDKALRIISSISLNYPKKNRYFADQIRFLERLIENNKEQ